MVDEKLKAIGTVLIEKFDENGQLTSASTHNLVVATGLAHIVSRMVGASQAVISHLGVGTNSTAAAAANTALGAQLVRVALDSTTIVTTSQANDSVQYVATLPAGTGTGALTEAGLFNAATAGTMLSRVVFDVVNKGALDVVKFTWKITIV